MPACFRECNRYASRAIFILKNDTAILGRVEIKHLFVVQSRNQIQQSQLKEIEGKRQGKSFCQAADYSNSRQRITEKEEAFTSRSLDELLCVSLQ